MTTGIYALAFGEDEETLYYIGKSVDIEKRWAEHLNKLIKGTAAKAMQEAYQKYGEPGFYILKTCHPDHLDVLEPLYIEQYKVEYTYNCINASIPEIHTRPSPQQLRLVNGSEYWDLSTLEHISKLQDQLDQIEDLELDVYGKTLEKLELQKTIEELKTQLAEQELQHKQELLNVDIGREGNFYRELANRLKDDLEAMHIAYNQEKDKPWYKKLW